MNKARYLKHKQVHSFKRPCFIDIIGPWAGAEMQKTKATTERRPWLSDLNFIVGCIAAGLLALLLHGLFSHVLDAHFHAGKVVRLISWLCFYLTPTILLLLLKPAKSKAPDEKKQIATIGLVNLSIDRMARPRLVGNVCV
jgi:hypothetical protein